MAFRRYSYLFTCFAVSACATPEHDPKGFSGYAFGSDHAFVQQEMANEGYIPLLATDEQLWYAGELAGLPVEFMYAFEAGRLSGGLWDIRDRTPDAWHRISREIRTSYPQAEENGCRTEADFCRIYCSVDARIVHLIDKDAAVHAVRYRNYSSEGQCT